MVSEGSTQTAVDYENLAQEKATHDTDTSLSENKEELDPEGGIQKQ